jgi:hypothetical protein
MMPVIVLGSIRWIATPTRFVDAAMQVIEEDSIASFADPQPASRPEPGGPIPDLTHRAPDSPQAVDSDALPHELSPSCREISSRANAECA